MGLRLCLAVAWAAWTIKATLNRMTKARDFFRAFFCAAASSETLELCGDRYGLWGRWYPRRQAVRLLHDGPAYLEIKLGARQSRQAICPPEWKLHGPRRCGIDIRHGKESLDCAGLEGKDR